MQIVEALCVMTAACTACIACAANEPKFWPTVGERKLTQYDGRNTKADTKDRSSIPPPRQLQQSLQRQGAHWCTSNVISHSVRLRLLGCASLHTSSPLWLGSAAPVWYKSTAEGGGLACDMASVQIQEPARWSAQVSHSDVSQMAC